MSPRETELMIDVLASTLPPRVDLNDESAVAEYLSRVCALYDYRPSTMNTHIPEIIKRAKALKLARAA